MGTRRTGRAVGRRARPFFRSEMGYTFPEILVILGVILGLGAMVIPAVERFSLSDGEDPATIEREAVQEALDALMYDRRLSYIDSVTHPDISVNEWSARPTGRGAVPLSRYLEKSRTTYFYCYDNSGVITQQDNRATPCPR